MTGRCVKCGKGVMSGPYYEDASTTSNPPLVASRLEWLVYRCSVCGYEKKEPTRDEKTGANK